MSITRRHLLSTATIASATAVLPKPLWATSRHTPWIFIPTSGLRGDFDLSTLAARAVDAAMSAGASYADVRLTLTHEEMFDNAMPTLESEFHGFGVRVLAQGCWGFLASAVWTPEEAIRLARGAVAQAKAHSIGRTRPLDIGPAVPPATGGWTMPVTYDPFTIPKGEKLDFMNDAVDYAQSRMIGIQAQAMMQFQRQYKVFTSSEGSAWSQTTYLTQGSFSVEYGAQYSLQLPSGAASADFLTPAGKGWEHISESGLLDAIPEIIDQAEQARRRVPVAPDRLDLVCSAQTVAAFADATIGVASELDRALGYEANAGGTSYLDDPDGMLGTYKVGTPLLNITANRSLPGGAATVKWDDESVEPETFQLVKDGILTDYQTTREYAPWIEPYYRKHNRSVRSHGCAGSQSAMTITMQHTPNLCVMPGETDTSFDDLVASTDRGIAVISLAGISMDQQQLNGIAYPQMRKIHQGKLGPFIVGGGILFRTPELLRSMTAMGGPQTARSFGFRRTKGQPGQHTPHTVTGVPAKFANVGIIDVLRKA